MPRFPKALIRIKDLNPEQIHFLFKTTENFKKNLMRDRASSKKMWNFEKANQSLVSLAFLEPSTRTRLSFATAAARLGLRFTEFVGDHSTSLKKGESISETLETVCAMDPDLVVLRYGGTENLWPILQRHNCAMINAGDGVDEHPTQALLDAFTILEKYQDLKGKKILYVGDVLHSRVAHSGQLLFKSLGAEVSSCGPEAFKPKGMGWTGITHFTNLKQALEWCDVCIGLRIQSERHQTQNPLDYSVFKLTPLVLKSLKTTGLILHPGPFVSGVDMEQEVLNDPRCVIHEQVRNGVYMRMSLLSAMLELHL